MDRSLLAMHGIHVTGKWWKGKTWATIRSDTPAWVIERKIPKGVGPLSIEVLGREVGD